MANLHHGTVLDFDFLNTLDQVGQTALVSTKKAISNPSNFYEEGVNATNKTCLMSKQLLIEDRQHANAVNDYVESLSRLMKNSNVVGLRHIQMSVLTWFEPLMKHIEAEQMLVKMKIPGFERDKIGSLFLLLSVDKFAVVTINTTLSLIIRHNNSGVPVRTLALQIGKLLQLEFNLILATEGDILSRWQKNQVKLAKGNERRVHLLARELANLLSEQQWSTEMMLHLGCSLLSMLMQTAKSTTGGPAFTQSMTYVEGMNKMHNTVGIIQLDDSVYKNILDRNLETLMPQYLPMVVSPRPWKSSKNRFDGGYYRLDCDFMRTWSKIQQRSLLRSDIDLVTSSLDYLSQIKWSINKNVYNVAAEVIANGELIGELPSRVDLALPLESEFLKPDGSIDQALFNKTTRLVTKANYELHSLRCDVGIKMSIAKEFLDDVVFFPCNVDFRGRVYPIPPNLNHLGSDLCRGLLRFSESKALGDLGLDWLKIHLCNLFGNNKISLAERRDWANQNLIEIFDSASNPLGGNRWWTTAESQFQALACCIEIKAAIDSGNPSTYQCSLPVHQDGSCNGLQHYAALGRDYAGGLAVNLISNMNDRPGDVYTAVLEIVNRKISEHAAVPDNPDPRIQQAKECALFLEGIVNRKVIKQTVMTSVYGVTSLGARDQILTRLLEIARKDLNGSPLTPAISEKNKMVAGFLAKLTLDSLGEMFKSADQIMKWLGDCATLIAKSNQVMSWVTPLGLPVMQPYRLKKRYEVKTILQNITLVSQKESLPVNARKQKTAFPPNFVHSLDASHMLLTAAHMRDKGLTFAAVHDSYWTYPSDIPIMAEVRFFRYVFLVLSN